MKRNRGLGSTRSIVSALIVIAALTSPAAWRSSAQEPPDAASRPNVQQSIRNALQGKSETASPNEPLLQDVLDLIKRQGSILDGSTLDVSEDEIVVPPAAKPEVQPRPAAKHQSAHSEAMFRTAEALLKASRLLGALPVDHERAGERDRASERRQLVRQMRLEATKCLLAAQSQAD